jgi:hypothetical protein
VTGELVYILLLDYQIWGVYSSMEKLEEEKQKHENVPDILKRPLINVLALPVR